ncbi:MAG: DUF721 domain-containing protein [Candidatus Magasanikbacteria bacterium]|jgi:hypothetical protein|nr:DUF721 domain-containing protein [Candidatus Magasanikbacteria bacterium]MBT4315281.1 DUF721 domain-containing protein [Candidatus Magasanikbacteria bacterium]MBT4547153.1 DUF721 domain-containing protein [Candidatus Magasanikbacteria bacterium]MBT6819715.1 DUF721 domain-containing protein [Candidatus Magasanikbacteria bacterium]
MVFSPLTQQDPKKEGDAHLLECAKKSLEAVLGETSKKIDPLFLKNRTLTVTCANSEIARELREAQEEIVVEINKMLDQDEVDRIRYLL